MCISIQKKHFSAFNSIVSIEITGFIFIWTKLSSFPQIFLFSIRLWTIRLFFQCAFIEILFINFFFQHSFVMMKFLRKIHFQRMCRKKHVRVFFLLLSVSFLFTLFEFRFTFIPWRILFCFNAERRIHTEDKREWKKTGKKNDENVIKQREINRIIFILGRKKLLNAWIGAWKWYEITCDKIDVC